MVYQILQNFAQQTIPGTSATKTITGISYITRKNLLLGAIVTLSALVFIMAMLTYGIYTNTDNDEQQKNKVKSMYIANWVMFALAAVTVAFAIKMWFPVGLTTSAIKKGQLAIQARKQARLLKAMQARTPPTTLT